MIEVFTGIYQSAVILATMVVFYTMDFLFIQRYDRLRAGSKTGRAWDYTLALVTVGIFIVLQPVFLPWLGISTKATWGLVIQIVGVLMLVGSLALHLWSRLHLRQFYAERVEVIEGHQVIQSGPYAFVRHPLIVSFFGLATGLLLVNPSIPTLLLAVYTFWDFSRAAIAEEKALSESLPEYVAYMSRTPRYIPRVFRRRENRRGEFLK